MSLILILVVVSLSTIFAQDDELDDYKLTNTELMGYEKLENTQCIGVDGYGADLLRDYVGTAKECRAKCDEFENCAGFVRVNGPKTSPFYGKCYFRADGLQDPFPYTNDNRDCYRSVRYNRNKGEQCWGSSADILRDFPGNAMKCAKQCDSMDECVGFVRVAKGSQYAGNCYFRGGSLETPYPYTGDKRSCFSPDQRIRKAPSNQVFIDENEYMTMVMSGSVNGLINNNNYNIPSMIMCVLFGVFIGLIAFIGYKAILKVCGKWRTSKVTESADVTTPLIKNGDIKV
mmetsp:Transcript_40942/g.36129  ORF Transcript_40942/g.36129 Transcript_40942/m.36129 type:complete len:287 (+) Transcript_40942:76-936(+)